MRVKNSELKVQSFYMICLISILMNVEYLIYSYLIIIKIWITISIKLYTSKVYSFNSESLKSGTSFFYDCKIYREGDERFLILLFEDYCLLFEFELMSDKSIILSCNQFYTNVWMILTTGRVYSIYVKRWWKGQSKFLMNIHSEFNHFSYVTL